MGLFDWLRPKPRRRSSEIVRELAETVFALHPSAKDRVVVRFDGTKVVGMEVPAVDAARPATPRQDAATRALATAELSRLIAQLAVEHRGQGDTVEVMRDRVIWMPYVLPVQPPLS